MHRVLSLLWSPVLLLRSCCLLLVIVTLLLVLGACLGIGWGLGHAAADAALAPAMQPPTPPQAQPLDAGLIIDQSDSLWTMGGTGSDPQQLRMTAARLFAARLGVEPGWKARLALVYFGTEARLVMPLSELANSETQQSLTNLGEPPRMGWTDIRLAVDMAEAELYTSSRADSARRKVVVIFTDGRPDTASLGKPDALPAYLDDLEARLHRLTQRGAVVFTVLLRNTATDADPLLQQVYRPFWVRLAEHGGSVRFYDVTTPEDLIQTYADIAMLVGAGASRGTVVSESVSADSRVPMLVSGGWRKATMVVRRSQPEMRVTIARPDGRVLRPDDPDVSRQGSERDGIEVWAVDHPTPGEWQVNTQGRGSVTVRLDYEPLPPTATPAPTATATVTTTPSPTVSATSTPTPTLTASSTPTPTALAVAPATSEGAASSGDGNGRAGGQWGRVGLGLVALAFVIGPAIWYTARQRTLRPVLDGNLRVLAAPASLMSGQVWDLTQYRQAGIVIGSGPGAQVILSRDAADLPSVRLERRAEAGRTGGSWLVVKEGGEVHLNGTLMRGERRLNGWDTIEVGGWKLRYENVRERAQSRQPVGATRIARR